MRVLVLDSASERCTAAVVIDRIVAVARSEPRGHGHEAILPALAQDVLGRVGGASVDLVAVTIGPGSFTGIRGGLALAHGVGLAAGVPVVGVTVGEAIADAFPHLGGRALWVVTESRRGRVFIECHGEVSSHSLAALPPPVGKVAIAGAAALPAAARLAAAGTDVMLTDARYPLPRHIASVAEQRHAGTLRPRAAQPLYVDPPEAKARPDARRPPPASGP